MEKPEVTKLSSRGQVVVPQVLRNKLGLEEGQQFVVIGEGDTLIFKKMEMPTMAKIKRLLEMSRRYAKQAGLTPKHVENAVKKVRREGRNRPKS